VGGEALVRGLHVLQGQGARLAVNQQLHAAAPALHLGDAHDGAHRVQVVGLHLVAVLLLRDGQHAPVARERGFDGLQRPRAPGRDRHGGPGKDDGLPQGEDRQHRLFAHWFVAFPFGRGRLCARRLLEGAKSHLPCHAPIPRIGHSVAPQHRV
jgi:hypothetical protein